jgi:hypothetical protein
VDHIVEWYRTYYAERDGDMFDLSIGQIDRYVEDAREKKLVWADS